jgi:hypothetical protein
VENIKEHNKKNRIIQDDELVYCTHCEYGNKLITSIENNMQIPEHCGGCYPYDCEDSRRYYLRKKYIPLKG